MSLDIDVRVKTAKGEQAVKTFTTQSTAHVKRMEQQTVSSAGKMQTAFSGLTKSIGLFAGVAGIGLVLNKLKNVTLETIQSRDAIAKFNIATGVSVEFLSAMGFSAERSGASMQSFQVGLRGLLRRMQDVKDGSLEGIRVFNQLGISATNTDGSLRKSETVFLEVADAISKMSNETEAAALAQEIFGRQGVTLIPLLKEGKKGIQELEKEARRLGITFDEKAAREAEAADDAITNFNTAITGLGNNLSANTLPTLTKIANSLADITAEFNKPIPEQSGLLKLRGVFGSDGFLNEEQIKGANKELEKTFKITKQPGFAPPGTDPEQLGFAAAQQSVLSKIEAGRNEANAAAIANAIAGMQYLITAEDMLAVRKDGTYGKQRLISELETLSLETETTLAGLWEVKTSKAAELIPLQGEIAVKADNASESAEKFARKLSEAQQFAAGVGAQLGSIVQRGPQLRDIFKLAALAIGTFGGGGAVALFASSFLGSFASGGDVRFNTGTRGGGRMYQFEAHDNEDVSLQVRPRSSIVNNSSTDMSIRQITIINQNTKLDPEQVAQAIREARNRKYLS